MADFDAFADYLGLGGMLFECDEDTKLKAKTKLPVNVPHTIRKLSLSSSMDNLFPDNSGSCNTSDRSVTAGQWNQPLDTSTSLRLADRTSPLDVSKSSQAITSSMAPVPTMSPLGRADGTYSPEAMEYRFFPRLDVPVPTVSPLDRGDEIFSPESMECPFFPQVDVTLPNQVQTPVGHAISGRYNTSSATYQELNYIGLDVDVPLQQCNTPPNVELSNIVQGMVKRAYRFEMMNTPKICSWAKVCVFCQRNGETKAYYSTHVLKDSRGKVVCPVLRNYVCPTCHATGDYAHTQSHCPHSLDGSSMADTFNTRRTSCGFRKFNH